ncbi:unnamed protein product, partial [marine sediment metagenome]
DVFAPLVICTTEGLPEIIESRCLLFSMQPNVSPSVEKRIDEKWAGKLRNKLTIFRANELDKDFKEPSRIARRRLNEILTPLFQVLLLTDPGRGEEFKSTIKEIEKVRAIEEGNSLEAEIVEKVTEFIKEEKQDFVSTKDITNKLNETRTERSKISDMLVSSRLKRLGFNKTRNETTGQRGFSIKPELLEKLQIRFGLEEYSLSPEEKKQKEFDYGKEEKNDDDVW